MAEGTGLLGERVRFLPDLPREDMPDLYRAADVFVLPSLHEMFGIVLLEALATGLPVVCNDTAEFRTIVGPGGLYRDFRSSVGVAAGLTALLDADVRQGLAQAGRAHVDRNFSEPVVTKAITSCTNRFRRRLSMVDSRSDTVSVIIPAYNAAAYVLRAIESALAQNASAVGGPGDRRWFQRPDCRDCGSLARAGAPVS